jgi:hypothetical protein
VLYGDSVNRSLATKLAINNLIWGRMAFGVTVWPAPRLGGRVFGIDMDENPPAAYLARVIAAREVVLASGVYGTDGDARRQWLLAGLVCDCADTVAAIAAGRAGHIPKRASVSLTAFAALGAVLSALVLRGR